MDEKQIQTIIANQRSFFNSNQTKDIFIRIKYLQKLKDNIKRSEQMIFEALAKDLGKSESEAYMTEVGMVYEEINHMLHHIKKYVKKKKIKTPISLFPASSYIVPEPLGIVLIMSPWNYPFNLTFVPLVDAIASGNTAIVKPSAYSSATSSVIGTIIQKTFPAEYVSTVQGGRNENQCLLNQKFDYIFFTGGKAVGRLVMEKASVNLTPVTLELGGKSPCIVCKDADIALAATRITFGKYLNAGQTCVAPDYLLIDYRIKEQFIEELKKEINTQYGINPIDNYNYGHIINEKHFTRLIELLKGEKIVHGGTYNSTELKIAPTIVDKVKLQSPLMQEEIFGPILPIMTYDKLDEVIDIIKVNDTPLALYLFTNDKDNIDFITTNIRFGGGCINDTISHLANSNMGFGGIGESGMGRYHGKDGFDTFSHYKSIVKKHNWLDIKLRYQPYNDKKMKTVKKILK